jgi:predicted glutamine amidotransferase
MCNINAIYRKNGRTNITGFLMAVSSYSFVHNSHGEGIYINSTNELYKSKRKIDYLSHMYNIEKSDVVITHQRYSTSGFELEYNHPFANDDFVIVHNGIINQFLDRSKGSDTYGFWLRFNEEFKKLGTKQTRTVRIVHILKTLFKENIGSYSILIYDKKTKHSYYFKNTPSIHFYTNDDYLFVTTESSNREFLSLISNKEFIGINIESRKIYEIKPNGEVYFLSSFPQEKIIESTIDEDYDDDYGIQERLPKERKFVDEEYDDEKIL